MSLSHHLPHLPTLQLSLGQHAPTPVCLLLTHDKQVLLSKYLMNECALEQTGADSQVNGHIKAGNSLDH